MKRKQLLDKNRKWVMARMGGPTVAANTVSPETQVLFGTFIFKYFIDEVHSLYLKLKLSLLC